MNEFLGKIDLCDELNCQLRNLSIAETSTSGLYLLQPGITYFVVIFGSKFSIIIYTFIGSTTFHGIILYADNVNDQATTLIPLVSQKIGKKCMEIFKKTRQKKNLQK